MRRSLFTCLGAMTIALLVSATAFAQGGGASVTGTIQGRVTDASGAVLPPNPPYQPDPPS